MRQCYKFCFNGQTHQKTQEKESLLYLPTLLFFLLLYFFLIIPSFIISFLFQKLQSHSRVVWLMINNFNFVLSENVLIPTCLFFFFFWRIFSLSMGFWVDSSSLSGHFLLASMVPDEKSTYIRIVYFLSVQIGLFLLFDLHVHWFFPLPSPFCCWALYVS